MLFLSPVKKSWGVSVQKAVQFLTGVIGVLVLCLPVFPQGNFGRILRQQPDRFGKCPGDTTRVEAHFLI
jgi:hypothetical protein